MKKFVVILMCLTFLGCTKEYSCEKCDGKPNEARATIIDGGELAVDGCSWLVRVDSTFYHADVLDAAFKKNLLEVKITYTTTPDTFICGFGASGIPVIHLLSIEAR